MSACIGWDGPCVVHGQFHGCRYPEGAYVHRNRSHECECGARVTNRDPGMRRGAREIPGCGTAAGYRRHRRQGEDACPSCKHAHAAYIYERGQRTRKAG